MRVIAGKWRGRPIQAPAGAQTRPTADRVREALFSMLTSRLGSFEGLRVVDGFAGTGALGIEALSRGAGHCSFVENDITASTILDNNLKSLQAKELATLVPIRMETLGPARAPVDLVLLDPPYEQGLAPPALARLHEMGWLVPATLISVETGRKEALDLPGFEILVSRGHGKACIHLVQLAG
ncbi:16S rRNA (guanine(966)-N(2))-methyltransferase RsmD [Polymorphobacter sp.]|uniref:16S rRNA (guanine(966)-N(2))-methyltransferase RsmD n=1 Tax=Polymorphobacter sp. TaxID=1909290 RepID=UPI003F6E996D